MAHPAESPLPIGPPVQLAYLVDDVERAAADFAADFGAGPFLWRRHAAAGAVDRSGAAGRFDHSSAYGQGGALQIELVEIHDTTSPGLVADLVPIRTGGAGSAAVLHHVAYFVDDIDEAQALLVERGFPAVMTATTANGSRFAFHDARHEVGHLLEIYRPTDGVARLYRRVADLADGWDGVDPVRAW